MDHLKRVTEEFRRQADTFDTFAQKTDENVAARFAAALGDAGQGNLLDVACGPGVVTAALAPGAKSVMAFDATQNILFCYASRWLLPVSILALAQAIPHLITRDLSSNAIIIYSSKAIGRLDYFLGKFLAAFGLLALTGSGRCWLPGSSETCSHPTGISSGIRVSRWPTPSCSC